MPDPVDSLYALPLEQFTPARDAAAREIRRAGDRDTAAHVAKLPKPTPAAWTANQVAREQPELMEALLDAGGALREAQEAALAGGGGRALRDATLAERRAVDAVMAAAAAYRPAGRTLSRAMAERLRMTLHAAAVDESIRDSLAGGRLVSEAQAGGAWPFAVDARAGAASETSGAAKAQAAAPAPAAQEARAAAERAELERAAREAAEARKSLEGRLREAREALRVRERALAAADGAAERAARAAAEAAERLEAARQAAHEAQAGAQAAATLRAEAQAALEQARDDVARLAERLD